MANRRLTTTKMMLTGADGTRIISVTRPIPTAPERPLSPRCVAKNAAVSASIDTIFTVVITSPDVDVARMWGHMLPSLTAADGAEYQRPQLYAELATVRAAQYTEDNEIWRGALGRVQFKNRPRCYNRCGLFPLPSRR